MSGIFVSYRHDDAAGYADLVYERLAARFGGDRVFMDVDSLKPGVDFGEEIDAYVGSCEVLIALIGRRWLAAMDAAGVRRLDDPQDWVRSEVATALARDVTVIPVLVDGARMPGAAELPDPLRRLARREALEISRGHRKHDLRRLADAVDAALRARGAQLGWRASLRARRPGRAAALATAAALAAGGTAVALAGGGGGGGGGSPPIDGFFTGVDSLIQQSGHYYGEVGKVATAMSAGTIEAGEAQSRLEAVTANRRTLGANARQLPTPTAQARTVRDAFAAAFDRSVENDVALEKCAEGPRAAWASCVQETAPLSAAASGAKEAFVAGYNRLRAAHGLANASARF